MTELLDDVLKERKADLGKKFDYLDMFNDVLNLVIKMETDINLEILDEE